MKRGMRVGFIVLLGIIVLMFVFSIFLGYSKISGNVTQEVGVDCEGTDVNQDGFVDVVDLLFLVDSFGTSYGDPKFNASCDMNKDGAVDVVDLLTLVGNFGKTGCLISNVCVDTDGDANPYMMGSVFFNSSNYTDYCDDRTFFKNWIHEYYCRNNKLISYFAPCPNAGTCNNGACSVPDPRCSDSDEGINLTVKGIVFDTNSNLALSDFCQSDSSIQEYYCKDNSGYTTTLPCPYGTRCKDGACIFFKSFVPYNVGLGDSFEIKCNFGEALPCVSANHNGKNCNWAGWDGTSARFNCVADSLGLKENYCNLFYYGQDDRCFSPQQVRIQTTNVSNPICISDSLKCAGDGYSVLKCNYNGVLWENYTYCPAGCINGKCNYVAPTCSDGTAQGVCSIIGNHYYCDGFNLTENCNACECQNNFICDYNSGKCSPLVNVIGVNCQYLLSEVTSRFGTRCGNNKYYGFSDVDKDGNIGIVDVLYIEDNLYDEEWCTKKIADNSDGCSPQPFNLKCTRITGSTNNAATAEEMCEAAGTEYKYCDETERISCKGTGQISHALQCSRRNYCSSSFTLGVDLRVTCCNYKKIAYQGATTNKINIAIIGEGMTDKEFSNKVSDAFLDPLTGFFGVEPYASYKSRFNVIGINAGNAALTHRDMECTGSSASSGTKEDKQLWENFLREKTYSSGLDFVDVKILFSSAKEISPYAHSPPSSEVFIGLDCIHTGNADIPLTQIMYSLGLDFDPLSIQLTLVHEIAHGLFNLDDEYSYLSEHGIGRDVRDGSPNCAKTIEEANSKWGSFIGQGNGALKIEIYEGCTSSTAFRSTYSGIMRDAGAGVLIQGQYKNPYGNFDRSIIEDFIKANSQ